MKTKECKTSSEDVETFTEFTRRLMSVPKKEIDEQLELERKKKQKKDEDKKRK